MLECSYSSHSLHSLFLNRCYNLSIVSVFFSPSAISGTRLFTASGTQYYHLFNISLCGEVAASCSDNISALAATVCMHDIPHIPNSLNILCIPYIPLRFLTFLDFFRFFTFLAFSKFLIFYIYDICHIQYILY